MASVNKVILIGNLGKDPEVRYFPDGTAVCNVSLATTRSWKDKESGERKEETEWHRVTFRGRLAEIAGEYLRKGRSVYVEGYLKTRKWQDKDGRDTYTTEIVALEMQMLGAKGEEGAETKPRTHSEMKAAARGEAPAKNAQGFDDMDDDIPFISSCFDCDMAMPVERRMRKYR